MMSSDLGLVTNQCKFHSHPEVYQIHIELFTALYLQQEIYHVESDWEGRVRVT